MDTATLLEEVQAQYNATAAMIEESNRSADTAWLLSSAFVVFTMQAGFGVLESGMVSSRNAVNILMKNLLDMSIGAIAWYTCGYAMSNGSGENGFVGTTNFLSTGLSSDDYAGWVFQFAFAATASTIVSGAVCGRMKFKVYCVISALLTGLVYPIAAFWQWNGDGWLNKMGFFDFAGCGAVHMLGGVVGLVATWMLKPRHGAFLEDGTYAPLRSSPTNVLLGVFILWWGWFGFNAGSTGGMGGGLDLVAAKAAMNTAIASGSGAITGMVFSYAMLGSAFVDVYVTVTGLLAGLVAITSACAVVEGWEALVIGIVGSVLANAAAEVLIKFQIDDPVGVVPVHCVCGMWGLLSVGFFAHTDQLADLGNLPGLFHGGGFKLLGIQALGLLVVFLWSLFLGYGVLKLMEVTVGIRVDYNIENDGLDAHEHNLVVIRMVESQHVDEEGNSTSPGEKKVGVMRHQSERAFVTHSMSEVAVNRQLKRMKAKALFEKAIALHKANSQDSDGDAPMKFALVAQAAQATASVAQIDAKSPQAVRATRRVAPDLRIESMGAISEEGSPMVGVSNRAGDEEV